MSSNKNQEVIVDYQKHESTKEKRTKKMSLKSKKKSEAFEDIMGLKKKTQSKKKSKYVNYKNIDFDKYNDDFDDYMDLY